MQIAIVGANGLIARDLCERLLIEGVHELTLYTRKPEFVATWARALSKRNAVQSLPYTAFPPKRPIDVIINFVGVADPRTANALGKKVFELSSEFDERCLGFVRNHPGCRYLFISSGAVFGSVFDRPASADTQALVNLNHPKPSDWYGLAKLYAELGHRAMKDHYIFDIRVFGYVSRNQSPSAQFLISDIIRHLINKEILHTSSDHIVRDYLHPDDFKSLISLLLDTEPDNMPLDAFSQSPVDKHTLLEKIKAVFGLQYVSSPPTPNGGDTSRSVYYSENRVAEMLGYMPRYNSLSGVIKEVGFAISKSLFK